MKTGTYKVINGRLEKISDAVPSLKGIFDVTWSNPYYSHSLGCYVDSKEQKRVLLKQRGLIEGRPDEMVVKRPTQKERLKKIEACVVEACGRLHVEKS
jgi:hypothetical protein